MSPKDSLKDTKLGIRLEKDKAEEFIDSRKMWVLAEEQYSVQLLIASFLQ